MGKHKDGKKHKKGSQLVIRVDKAERDAFVSLCDALDTSAAREIRRFMRDWVAAHGPKPADRDVTAEPAAAPDAAAADAPAADVEEAVTAGQDMAIAAEADKGAAKAPKAPRKAAKAQ